MGGRADLGKRLAPADPLETSDRRSGLLAAAPILTTSEASRRRSTDRITERSGRKTRPRARGQDQEYEVTGLNFGDDRSIEARPIDQQP
jgi:hypothetical protein